MNLQLLLENRNQPLNTTRLLKHVTVLPQGFLVRRMIKAPKTCKLLESGAVQKQELQAGITQAMHDPQQKTTKDNKSIPEPMTTTRCPGRTKGFLQNGDNHLQPIQISELGKGFLLLFNLQQVSLPHLDSSKLSWHKKEKILKGLYESQNNRKSHDLRA